MCIELVGSPEMDPNRRWHGGVEITLRDGRMLKHYTHLRAAAATTQSLAERDRTSDGEGRAQSSISDLD